MSCFQMNMMDKNLGGMVHIQASDINKILLTRLRILKIQVAVEHQQKNNSNIFFLQFLEVESNICQLLILALAFPGPGV